jgi:glycosyltransferase involved in cell wall biosynthesis
VEARTIGKREILWAKQANSVSLVSPTEAARFSERIGKPVHCLPMRAQFPPANFVQPKRERSLVFLGGLDYQPNLDALRYYRDQILPLLLQTYPEGLPLHVIGKAPDKIRAELASPHIHLHGYVTDLTSELCKHAIFFAPITHGTGIKTKVLDAMGHALPVITTSKGIEGMGALHEQHCLVGNTPLELAAAIRQCLEQPAYAEQLAQAGAAHIRQHFSSSVLAEKWAKVLAGAKQ